MEDNGLAVAYSINNLEVDADNPQPTNFTATTEGEPTSYNMPYNLVVNAADVYVDNV